MRCQEPGCPDDGRACFLPPYGRPEADWDTPDYFYCFEHVFAHGFCRGCGAFWGGVESFEFRQGGLCDDCFAEEEAELRDEREDDDDESVWVYEEIGP